jgi:hypothetical protein
VPLPADLPAPLLPELAQVERPRIDYAVLDAAVADCEQAIRATRQALERLVTERQTSQAPGPRVVPKHLTNDGNRRGVDGEHVGFEPPQRATNWG